MTFQVKAEILLNNANWEKNLKKTSKQMEGFGKSMKSISNGIKAAWAGVALLGIGALYDGIVDVTKAAAEEAKTTALLNSVLDKNWKATDQQKASVDDYINSIGALTGILDDDLKKAYSTVARQTKSQEKANKMLALSTDIAADKNISVEKAAKLVAKAMAGNQNAFNRLYPSAAKYGDALGYVTQQTAGLAQLAGENNPFARIDFIINEFKEKVGMAFLPLANNVAEWLGGKEAQAGFDKAAKYVQDTFSYFTSPEGQAAIAEWYEKVKLLINRISEVMEGLLEIANSPAIKFLTKDTTSGLYDENGKPKASPFAPNIKPSGKTGIEKIADFFSGKSSTPSKPTYQGNSSDKNQAPININFYGNTSAEDQLKALKRLAAQKGLPFSKLLG
jgi:hypothetical protein